MAPTQKATWARPSLAAIPTQLEPTTQRICARTRSPRPSSLRSPRSILLAVAAGTVPSMMAQARRFPWIKSPFHRGDAETRRRLRSWRVVADNDYRYCERGDGLNRDIRFSCFLGGLRGEGPPEGGCGQDCPPHAAVSYFFHVHGRRQDGAKVRGNRYSAQEAA